MTDAAPPVEAVDVLPPPAPVARVNGKFAPGHARLGGRRKHVSDSTRTTTIEKITRTADPIGRLCRIAAGQRFRAAPTPGDAPVWLHPTPADVLTALRILAGKVMPDLRAVDVKTDSNIPPLILNIAQAVRVTGRDE